VPCRWARINIDMVHTISYTIVKFGGITNGKYKDSNINR